ncbi:magnesium/cobalt transporter CorA [Alloacidobacterium dinghuense]|uniref:Magnesium transport protein CorA n=1 Tax=Alloacidobacterium dinghuense TaxID=2763107 RepID=A0A7G8BN38_9BACT|nr:magnesium/cobalt transporter CorA [Alloacidobacterium dinghuense]QNI33958.1 magnesium/cobalt transporter CorA [Alloacidobacterium dinghuense]
MEWHNIIDASRADLDALAERYHLHPLHIEDCRQRLGSAKIEEGETYLFTVVKCVELRADGNIDAHDVDLFLGRDYLITVLEPDDKDTRQNVERLRANNDHSRPDQLYYRIVDATVDKYLPVLDHFNEIIDDLEDIAMEAVTPKTLSRIFEIKRVLIELRRILGHTRDVSAHLQRVDSPYIKRDMWPFLRDVYDHIARNLDHVEMLRDLLNGCLDVYLSSVANRTNQVMKVLTVLSTIALPALVVSGIYGMNVKGLPGSETHYGLLIVIGMMVASTVILLWILRRFDWL